MCVCVRPTSNIRTYVLDRHTQMRDRERARGGREKERERESLISKQKYVCGQCNSSAFLGALVG